VQAKISFLRLRVFPFPGIELLTGEDVTKGKGMCQGEKEGK
jgi:hypothetical protein